MEYFNYLYENPIFLEYLRYNPEWYKILHYSPERFNEFLKEAKEKMKITAYDKIEEYKNRLDLFINLLNYIK